MALALAKEEYSSLGLQARASQGRVFRFRLLAASTNEDFELPESNWSDLSHLLLVKKQVLDQELHVRFQAIGFEALRQVAGKKVRLRSADGFLDDTFGFDSQGSGVLVFRNSVSVKRALQEFVVTIICDHEKG